MLQSIAEALLKTAEAVWVLWLRWASEWLLWVRTGTDILNKAWRGPGMPQKALRTLSNIAMVRFGVGSGLNSGLITCRFFIHEGSGNGTFMAQKAPPVLRHMTAGG